MILRILSYRGEKKRNIVILVIVDKLPFPVAGQRFFFFCYVDSSVIILYLVSDIYSATTECGPPLHDRI